MEREDEFEAPSGAREEVPEGFEEQPLGTTEEDPEGEGEPRRGAEEMPGIPTEGEPPSAG